MGQAAAAAEQAAAAAAAAAALVRRGVGWAVSRPAGTHANAPDTQLREVYERASECGSWQLLHMDGYSCGDLLYYTASERELRRM